MGAVEPQNSSPRSMGMDSEWLKMQAGGEDRELDLVCAADGCQLKVATPSTILSNCVQVIRERVAQGIPDPKQWHITHVFDDFGSELKG